MEKKKAAKALMVAAALAGGITVGQSFFNEAQATGNDKKPTVRSCPFNGRDIPPNRIGCTTGSTICYETSC